MGLGNLLGSREPDSKSQAEVHLSSSSCSYFMLPSGAVAWRLCSSAWQDWHVLVYLL